MERLTCELRLAGTVYVLVRDRRVLSPNPAGTCRSWTSWEPPRSGWKGPHLGEVAHFAGEARVTDVALPQESEPSAAHPWALAIWRAPSFGGRSRRRTTPAGAISYTSPVCPREAGMAIELAVVLGAIAARTLVSEIIRGATMPRDDWADVAADVVGALITTSYRQESGLQQLNQGLGKISQQIDDTPVREFDQHMVAGRRFLRDLPVAWRTAEDRRDLIRDARAEFVRAAAIAELRKDLSRQALAEVAIAGLLAVGAVHAGRQEHHRQGPRDLGARDLIRIDLADGFLRRRADPVQGLRRTPAEHRRPSEPEPRQPADAGSTSRRPGGERKLGRMRRDRGSARGRRPSRPGAESTAG